MVPPAIDDLAYIKSSQESDWYQTAESVRVNTDKLEYLTTFGLFKKYFAVETTKDTVNRKEMSQSDKKSLKITLNNEHAYDVKQGV